MPDLRDASPEEVAETLPGVSEEGAEQIEEDFGNSDNKDNDDSGGDTSNEDSSQGKVATKVASVRDPETGKAVKATNPLAQAAPSESGDPVFTPGEDDPDLSNQSLDEASREQVQKIQDQAEKVFKESDFAETQIQTGKNGTKVTVQGQNLPDLENSGRQQRPDNFLRGAVPTNPTQARQALFRREQEQTRQQLRQLYQIEKPEVQKPDFGTIDDQEFYREQTLEQQSNLDKGQLDIIRTAAQQSAIEGSARQGGRELTGTELGGSIAVGGQSLGTDPLLITDQTGSIVSASGSNTDQISTLPGRTAEGFPKVVTEIVQNPVEEAAPEILTGLSGGTSISITESSTPTFIDESSTVIGQGDTSTNTFDGTLDPENIPGTENLPDLGEESTGRSAELILQEPESQITGGNLQEQRIIRQPSRQTQQAETGFGEPRGEAQFEGRGTEPGIPSQREGLTREEVQVLEQRRSRQGDEIDTQIEGFGDDGRTATDVRFERTIGEQGDATISEQFDSSDSDSGGLLSNTRKGQTSGIPLVRQRPSTRETVEPNIDSEFGEVNVEQGDNINIVEDRTRGDSSVDESSTGSFDTDINTEVDQGIISGAALGTSQRTAQGIAEDQGLGQELEFGEELVQEQTTDSGTTVSSTPSITDPVSPPAEEVFPGLDRSTQAFSSTSTPDRENSDNGETGLFELFSRSQDRDVQRSVGADLLGLEGREITEEQATNPLSLRPLDEN